MIVALGSLHHAAAGIIRSGDYSAVEAPEDFIAYRPKSPGGTASEETDTVPTVVLSGSGTERARRATQWAIEQFSPDAIISFGFCGATRDHEQSGDIVIAASVVGVTGTPFEWSMADTTASFGPDRTLQLAARTAVEVAGLDYHHGTVVTVSSHAKTSGMKRWLGEAMSAEAVDTETYAVAAAASRAGIPWVSVLSILDSLDFDLPAIIDRLGSGPRQRGVIAYLRHLSRSPSNLSSLLQLVRSSKRASASLTIFLAAFMEAHSAITNEDEAVAAV